MYGSEVLDLDTYKNSTDPEPWMNFIQFILDFRHCNAGWKERVPLLTTYEALQGQFNWLTSWGISGLVQHNLIRDLGHLELFLR
jgi:hypothetical protein